MKRIVVKIGTGVLSKEGGMIDAKIFADLVRQIVLLRKKKIQVVIVSSGAVGAGKSLISLPGIKSKVVQKQIFAAVGQVKLMNMYSDLFKKSGYLCAQVLATKEDFRDEQHYLNMQNCFEGLLLDNVIPIVNENDVVATTELMFTDNDELAGLVTEQVKADNLIILTSTEGILDGEGKTVSMVAKTNVKKVLSYINPDKSTGGRGGMASKFAVARDLAKKGISVYIVNGKRKNVLLNLAAGKLTGTHFKSQK